MIIQNFNALAITSRRKLALRIAEAGLGALQSEQILAKHLKASLGTMKVQGRVRLIAIGTMAQASSQALQKMLGQRLVNGFVIDVSAGKIPGMVCKIASLNPTNANVAIADELISWLGQCTKEDLILCLLSHGAENMLCSQSEVEIYSALQNSGATMAQAGIMRAHLDKTKGGGLSQLCYPAHVAGIVFKRGDEALTGSAISRDATMVRDAETLLHKFNILAGANLDSTNLLETPKQDKYFEKVTVLNVRLDQDVLAKLRDEARNLGVREVKVGLGSPEQNQGTTVRITFEHAKVSGLLSDQHEDALDFENKLLQPVDFFVQTSD